MKDERVKEIIEAANAVIAGQDALIANQDSQIKVLKELDAVQRKIIFMLLLLTLRKKA